MKKFCASILLVLLLGGCGGGDGDGERLPEARTLLERSAEAMSKVTSVGFDLDIEGAISSFQVKDAVGVIRSDGKVRATAHLNQGGQLVEYEYVLVDGKSYLKGPTGGFQEVPEAITARFFNPTALLTGERSLANGLAESRDARTEAEDEVNGVETYRIKATVNASRVEGLALLASGSIKESSLWIDRETNHLIRAVLPFELGSTDEETVVNVTFSNFNENVEITPPI